MPEVSFQSLCLVIVGFAVGFLSGLLGIGGGIISVPVLVAMGMSPALSVGTSSFCVLVAVSWGTYINAKAKLIDYTAVVFTLPITIVTAVYGILALEDWSVQSFHLYFACFTGICAVLSYLKLRKSRVSSTHRQASFSSFHPFRLLAGALAGFVNGAFGVGGGIVIVPLHLIAGDHLKKIVPISLAIISATSLISVSLHGAYNHISWLEAFALSIATIPGSQIGTAVLKKAPDRWIHAALILVLVAVSGSSVWKFTH